MISSITKSIFLLVAILQVILILQSCGDSGCGGNNEPTFVLKYFIQIDSISNDSIKQISYKDGGKQLYPNSRISEFYFTPSKSFTEIYITTFKQIDTLIFDNSKTFAYYTSPCDNNQLVFRSKDNIIVKHTFDSMFITIYDPNKAGGFYSSSSTNYLYKTLHVRLK